MLSRYKKEVRSFFHSIFDERNFGLFEKNQLLIGKIKSDFNKINREQLNSINEYEFSVFSQFGEDGIIQYLVNSINISNNTFVEFGVENYRESNTRFLLMNNNWRGLIIDSSELYISQIRKSEIHWKYDLQTRIDFITKENINKILVDENLTGDIGLLSIDIDGNDYWVWEEISVIRPDILVIEYNSLFGTERHCTIPYQPDFYRYNYHYSGLLFGASLASLVQLSHKKGYFFVGCNQMGNNAFFVKKEKIGRLNPVSIEQGYKEAMFRESRDKNGVLNYKRGAEKFAEIKNTGVINTQTGQMEYL